MALLIVCKALTQESKLGPFYWPEVAVLVIVELTLFFGILLLHSCMGLSRWWLLSIPALFFVVLGVVQTFRHEEQALLLPSWYAWHFLHPRHVRLQPFTPPKPHFVRPPIGQQTLFPKPLRPRKRTRPRKVPPRRARPPRKLPQKSLQTTLWES